MTPSWQKIESQEWCGVEVKILSGEMERTTPDATLAVSLGSPGAELGGLGTPDFCLQGLRGPCGKGWLPSEREKEES